MLRSIALLLAIAMPVSAQPGVQPPPRLPPIEKFPAFGGATSEQLFQSNISLLAGQVANELGGVKGEAAKSTIPPVEKPAFIRQIDQTIAAAERLRTTAVRGTPERIREADAALDKESQAMSAQVMRFSKHSRGMMDAYARFQYADQQLHAAVWSGGGGVIPPAGVMEHIRRSASLLQEQADTLRVISEATRLREIERATAALHPQTQKFLGIAEKTIAPNQLTGEFEAVLGHWRAVSAAIAYTKVPFNVQMQATRVESTLRIISEMVPPPGGGWNWSVPNPAPPPGPGPGPVWPHPGFGFLGRGALAVGAGQGGGPRVRIFGNIGGESSYDFFAYDPNFRGGIRVAVADLNGDGIPDLVTAPGPGMPALIRVFDGRNMRLMTEFMAFEPNWTGGVFVAASDRLRDGRAWIAVSADAGGGPQVKVFDIAAGKEIDSFFAFSEKFRGGCRIALGDVNGDGIPDVLAVPGPGHDPRVRVFNGRNRAILSDFMAFERGDTAGLNIAAADLTRNGRADMIVGSEAPGPSTVRVFDAVNGKKIGEIDPYPKSFRGGVRVSAYDFDRNGVPDVVCAPGGDPNHPALPIRVFSGMNARPLGSFFPFEESFRGGAFVGSR